MRRSARVWAVALGTLAGSSSLETMAASTTFDLYVTRDTGAFRLFATTSAGDNTGLATFASQLAGITTIQNLAPAAFNNLATLSPADKGFVLFRSNANESLLFASQNFGSATEAADLPAVIRNVGQASGDITAVATAVKVQPVFTSPVLLASGTFPIGQHAAVNLGQTSASVFTNLSNLLTTPSTVIKNVHRTLQGDVTENGLIDTSDIDAVFAGIRGFSQSGAYVPPADLTLDGRITQADADLLITGILQTFYGDLNLDGAVSIGDLVLMAESFNSAGGWMDGDLNGDGMVTIGDLVLLAENFGLSQPVAFSGFTSISIPEPGVASLLIPLSVLAWGRRGRASRSGARTGKSKENFTKFLKKGLAVPVESCILSLVRD